MSDESTTDAEVDDREPANVQVKKCNWQKELIKLKETDCRGIEKVALLVVT